MATGWQWREKETFREEVDYDENGTRFTRTVKVEEMRNNLSFLLSFGVKLSAPRLVSIPFMRDGNRLFQPEMNLEV